MTDTRATWTAMALAISLLLGLPSGLLAQGQSPAALNSELEGLAQQLAQLVAEPGFRGFLRSEIAKSRNRENIVELDKFLARASRRPDVPPGLAAFRQSARGVGSKLKFGDLEGLDLYIPVEAHRAKWRGGDDLLVAYAPVDDESDVSAIIAYDVRTGNRVTLDPTRTPTRVVLILAPEEHENHDVPTGQPDRDQRTAGPEARGREAAATNTEGEGSGASYIGIRRIRIRDVKEPWYAGDAEIYVWFGMIKGNYCKTDWVWGSLNKVDDEGTWYTVWRPSTGRCPAGESCWYFANNPFGGSNYYWNRVRLDIYESDYGFIEEKVYELYPGKTCSLQIPDGNDYVDHGYVWENGFNFNYDLKHDMGNAYVYWHKIH